MLGGDFKTPLFPFDKYGGLKDFNGSMGILANFIATTSMVDIDL